jgi:hypothetical protein
MYVLIWIGLYINMRTMEVHIHACDENFRMSVLILIILAYPFPLVYIEG